MQIIKFIFESSPVFLSLLGILAVIFTLWKVIFPGLALKIVSSYYTLDRDRKAIVILKLQTTSNVDLVLENVEITMVVENGEVYKMIPHSPRWKGVYFKMLDILGQERDFKLLKPLDPDIRTCGIKKGNNEYYVALKSEGIYEDTEIKSWAVKLKWRQHLLPVPNMPWFNQKAVSMMQPEGKDIYFDDSLFKKISPKERDDLIREL